MRFKFAALLLTISIMFLFSANIIYAIGISPSTIKYEQMIRGGYAERYITISNTEDQTMAVRAGVEGAINPWIRVEPSNTTIEPMTTAIFKVIAEPPIDLANGAYTGSVLIVGQPAAAAAVQGTGISTVSGVSAMVYVSVNDEERKGYSVETIAAYDTEECRDINLQVGVRNTGNVRVVPRFTIDIKDKSQTRVLQSKEFVEAEVLPTKINTFLLQIPYSMEQFQCIPEGSYYADFKAYIGDQMIDEKVLPFSIHQRGFLTVAGEIQKVTAKTEAQMGELVKIDVLFKNIGKIPVNAKVKAEVYQDGVLTSVLESDGKEFIMGVADTLTVYFTPSWIGKYIIRITGIYEGKETAPKEITIDVKPSTTFYGMVAGGMLAVVGAIAYLFFKKRKGKKKRR